MKRYVLLEGNKLIDTTETKGCKIGSDYAFYERDVMLWDQWRCRGRIEKMSDNLIDLIEVGDMVETDSDMILVKGMTQFKHIFRENYDLIKAIWKRQGDTFKRYEVGE